MSEKLINFLIFAFGCGICAVLSIEFGYQQGWRDRTVSCDGRPEVVVQETNKVTCVYPGRGYKEVKL